MGGRPLAVMNLLAFPCSLGPDVVGEVVRGGAEKVLEAGAVVVGGHTIDDKEPKFGLSVFGTVHPDRVIRNRGALPGDEIVLTKPIGTGLWGTALKRELVTEEDAREVIESMAALNRGASEAMVEVGVHAATDVTGFGLLGHLHEMAGASSCGAEVVLDAVPLFDGALAWAEQGVAPGRTAEVVAWANDFVRWHSAQDRDVLMRVLCDPQTSGGLLMAVSARLRGQLLAALQERGVQGWVVGRFTGEGRGAITVS